ncbi:thiol:disulfide interchange protein DsbA/DsbL [Polycyclovorans algicola]|uniref:thiol:disulfide interchange protein DsbA/DsbL n=1 Tax=Polycyclovorans algicola TaxID=616992 RepID=UPI0004A7067D|nr:thiol:disulfide interchange protein DsbA/DsbL [Polycyclovorans algicola]
MLLRVIALGLSALTFACSAESPANFSAGKDYREVRDVQAPADPAKISVQEFFWYGCNHCYNFESNLTPWKKSLPADVQFEAVPNSLGRPVGVLHSKAFYTAETLKVMDVMHEKLFQAMHVQRLQLSTDAQIVGLFEAHTSLMPDVVQNTFNGFAVDARVRRAEKLSRDFGVSSTPTVVVGGKYYTNPSMAGGFDEMLAITDHLIDKVRAERER